MEMPDLPGTTCPAAAHPTALSSPILGLGAVFTVLNNEDLYEQFLMDHITPSAGIGINQGIEMKLHSTANTLLVPTSMGVRITLYGQPVHASDTFIIRHRVESVASVSRTWVCRLRCSLPLCRAPHCPVYQRQPAEGMNFGARIPAALGLPAPVQHRRQRLWCANGTQ